MKEEVRNKREIARPLLILAIIFTLAFCGWGVVRIVKSVVMDINCTAYIKRAADASTVELAKTELKKAMDWAERNDLTEGIVSVFIKNPANDVGFWYGNMRAAYEELDGLSEEATPLEKTNVLLKLRESLTDGGAENTSVTMPEGISVYPQNVVYFWWGMLSGVGMTIFWVVWGTMTGTISAETIKKAKK